MLEEYIVQNNPAFEASSWLNHTNIRIQRIKIQKKWKKFSQNILFHHHLEKLHFYHDQNYKINYMSLKQKWWHIYYYIHRKNSLKSKQKISSPTQIPMSSPQFTYNKPQKHNSKHYKFLWDHLLSLFTNQQRYKRFLAYFAKYIQNRHQKCHNMERLDQNDTGIQNSSKSTLIPNQTSPVKPEAENSSDFFLKDSSTMTEFSLIQNFGSELAPIGISSISPKVKKQFKSFISSYLLRQKLQQIEDSYQEYTDELELRIQQLKRNWSKFISFLNKTELIEAHENYTETKKKWIKMINNSLHSYMIEKLNEAKELHEEEKENLKNHWITLIKYTYLHELKKRIQEYEKIHNEKQINKAGQLCNSLYGNIGNYDSLLSFVVNSNIVPKNPYAHRNRPIFPKQFWKDATDDSYVLARKYMVSSIETAMKTLTTEESNLATAFSNAQLAFYLFNNSKPKDPRVKAHPAVKPVDITFYPEDFKRKEVIEDGYLPSSASDQFPIE